MLKRLFTEHPESVDEGYFEHLGVALSFSAKMLLGAVVCGVHAFLPFLFVKSASQVITGLHERMVSNRNRHAQRPASGSSDRAAA